MRRILAIVLLYAVHAVAGDVTGKWSGSFEVGSGRGSQHSANRDPQAGRKPLDRLSRAGCE